MRRFEPEASGSDPSSISATGLPALPRLAGRYSTLRKLAGGVYHGLSPRRRWETNQLGGGTNQAALTLPLSHRNGRGWNTVGSTVATRARLCLIV